MKNIKTLMILASIASAVMGCNKTSELDMVPAGGNGQKIAVTVGVGASTKATGVTSNAATSESKVNTLQVFVFQSSGARDGYGSSAGSKSATVECTAGTRDVYALVNCPDFSSVVSKSELLEKVSLLSNNNLSSFEMIGCLEDQTLSASGSLSLEVKRLAGRVVINKITRAFTGAYADVDFAIDAIYAINVAGDACYDLSASDSPVFFNEEKFVSSSVDALTADVLSSPATVANNGSYETAHYFYGYPNDNSTKQMRLVIEATMDGVKTYYPIDIKDSEGKFNANQSYEISSVTITRRGSDDPDAPVVSGTMTFEISVKNWDVVAMGDITI